MFVYFFHIIFGTMKCPKCGSRDIDFQEAGGQSICVSCGTVLEENTIVASIEFQVILTHVVLPMGNSLVTDRFLCISGNW